MFDILQFRTHEEIGRRGAELAVAAIQRAHAEGREATVLLAAAPSQLPVLTALAQADVHAMPVRYFHMDDYVGLPAGAPQAFATWLEKNYFAHLPEGHHGWFERIQTSGDPEHAATEYGALLPEGDFDLVLCGIGVNGHLAFNDPGCDMQDPLPVRPIRLAEASRQQQVDEGLFPSLADVPESAITLTVPRMLAAHTVVCSVLGAAKSVAVAQMLERPVTNAVPATALKTHPDATLLVDAEALSYAH